MFEEIDFIKAEMFAESEIDFFLKTADMQIKFVKDANGKATGFAVHQGDGTLYEVVNAQTVSPGIEDASQKPSMGRALSCSAQKNTPVQDSIPKIGDPCPQTALF
jgi:hypothetical protein